MTQASLTGLFPGVSFPSSDRVTLHVDTGSGGSIAAYGIIADNVSQDLTTSPGIPLGTTSSALGLWLGTLAAGGAIVAYSRKRR